MVRLGQNFAVEKYYSKVVKLQRAKVHKRIVENYTRKDIHCGLIKCTRCKQSGSVAPCLESEPSSDSPQLGCHYIIPDADSILDQIDVLDDESIQNVIIPLSVLKTVKFRSRVIYKRLLDLSGNQTRRFYILDNTHFESTYVKRNKSLTSHEHNQRCYAAVVEYYVKHVSKVKIVAMTVDPFIIKQLDRIKSDQLSVIGVEAYINLLEDSKTTLLSKLRIKLNQNDRKDIGDKALFPAFYSLKEIFERLRRGDLLQGTFYVNGHNFLEGSVTVESYSQPILISGYKCLNRAIDSDRVALEILPESEWKTPTSAVVEDDLSANLDDLEKKNLEAAEKVQKRPTGQIVGIIRRKRSQYCGIVEKNPFSAFRHTFIPADRKYPRLRFDTANIDSLVGKKIIAAIDDWPRYSRYPFGHFVKTIGDIGNKDVENEVLLLEHDVPYSKFSENVIKCLPKLPWIISQQERDKRIDLRDINICSVDPVGCTDIDDALHCYKQSNGTFSVGVHIADVSHFIRPGTAIDDEAAKRGTTVYLADKRIDMVPELLSSNLCSLREHEERFAFSCVWTLNSQAEILDTKFHKSIILSKRAFTYEEAQMQIDDPNLDDDITNSLRDLNKLAKILKKQRLKNGALVLSSPEVRFHISSETHDPLEIRVKKHLDTMSMVEEFMLLANISVAKRIHEDFPECAVLRRHPEPPLSNFEPLLKAARTQGFELKVSSGKELATSLDKAVKKNNKQFNNMLRIVATRCMLQAVYFSSGILPEKDYFHYGLAAKIYTHFTSPIRRYADIMVHRLLAATIGADVTSPTFLDCKYVSKICENLNYRNRMAQYAGRASVALNTHLFFKNQPGGVLEEEGNILYVRANALQVLILKYGLEGTIFLEPPEGRPVDPNLNYPKFIFNEEHNTQTAEGITLKPFDKVKVRLEIDASNVQREKIVFSMVAPVQVGVPKKKIKHGGDGDNKDSPVSKKQKNSALKDGETTL